MSLPSGARPDPNAAVQVGRLHQRFVCADAAQAAALSGQWSELSAAWQGSLQGVDEAVLNALPDDPEEWVLIPRVQVQSRWRPEAPTPQWGQDWWQAVGRAVDDCVQSPQTHAVLRYRRRSVALADLLYRSALGDTSRQWAWQCMGLIGRGDRADLSADEALQQGWSHLCAQPAEVAPVLQALLRAERDTGAWGAVLRRLSLNDWRVLRAALPGAWATELQGRHPSGTHQEAAASEPGVAAPLNTPVLMAWQAWVKRQPALVARWAASPDIGDALAALLGAWCWPWAQAAEVQARWPRWRAQVFQGVAHGQAATGRQAVRRAVPEASPDAPWPEPVVRPSQAGSNPGEAPTVAHEPADREGAAQTHQPSRREVDEPMVPELPQQLDARHTVATAWAGACFWLGRLPRVWPTLCAELASRLSPGAGHASLLHAEACLGAALAEALGVPPHDPVSRLWCGGFGVVAEGGSPGTEALSPEHCDAVHRTARQQVRDWSERLWADLGEDAHAPGPDGFATPEVAMAWLVQRPAILRVEPGWVEVCFEPDQVDTRIRRLALDLDPGWVPLCNAVVRFRYA